MNQRTILLAAAAGAVFALYLADTAYRNAIEEPTQRLEGQLRSIDSEMGDAKQSQLVGKRLAAEMDGYAERALPYEAELARSRYQEWLLQLVEKHEMQAASVDAELPRLVESRSRLDRGRRNRIGYRIQYGLRARTTLRNLTDFLYDFHRSAQLHKIRSFSLTPLVDGNQLDLSLEIETVSLEAAERKGELSSLVREDATPEARSTFDDFVDRNLFAKGFSRALGQVRLNAITKNREGELEAWFAVGAPSGTQRIAVGQTVQLPLHRIEVIGFVSGGVELSVNGLPCQVDLGQSLAEVFQMQFPELAASGTAAERGSDADDASEPSTTQPTATTDDSMLPTSGSEAASPTTSSAGARNGAP